MKRRNKSWLIAALVALSAVMVLTGCSLSQVLSLTIVDYPATTYEVGSNPDIEFTVEAEMDNGDTRTLTYNEYSSVLKLSGFSTAEIGTFTATVTYRNVSATFDYEVVATSSDFAGGVGTESNPYIINTAEQFKKIGNDGYEGKYFRLGADIELNDSDSQGLAWQAKTPSIVLYFEGVLDGNGYKITVNSENMLAVFGDIRNTTIKNLDVYSSGVVTLVENFYYTVTLQDVNRYGEMVILDAWNTGAFGIYAWNTCNLLFENCANYVNMLGTSLRFSGFIGYPLTNANGTTKIVLRDCVNYGNMVGQQMSAFFANNSSVDGEGIVLENCFNEGRIVTTEASGFYFAVGDTKPVAATNTGNRNNGTQSTLGERSDYEASVIMEEGDSQYLIKVEKIGESEVAYAMVRATYYASGADGTLVHYTTETLDLTNQTSAQTERVWWAEVVVGSAEEATIVNGGEWSLATEGENAGKYIHYNEEYPNANDYVSIYVMVFDADGNLIGGKTVK